MAAMLKVDGGRVRLDRIEAIEVKSVQSHGNTAFQVELTAMSGRVHRIKQGTKDDAVATATILAERIDILP